MCRPRPRALRLVRRRSRAGILACLDQVFAKFDFDDRIERYGLAVAIEAPVRARRQAILAQLVERVPESGAQRARLHARTTELDDAADRGRAIALTQIDVEGSRTAAGDVL